MALLARVDGLADHHEELTSAAYYAWTRLSVTSTNQIVDDLRHDASAQEASHEEAAYEADEALPLFLGTITFF